MGLLLTGGLLFGLVIYYGLQWARRTPAGLIDTKPACISLLLRIVDGDFNPAERAQTNKYTGWMLTGVKPVTMVSKTMINVVSGDGVVPCAVYTPGGKGPFPILIWMHGGCWVAGEPDHGESELHYIADRAGVVVVSIDYRLAPEHPYPAGFDDCYWVASWLASNAAEINGDHNYMSIGGSSAGGNLAAAVALRARDEKGVKFRLQYLQVPVTDAVETDQWPSYQESKAGYVLSGRSMKQAIDLYAPEPAIRRHPYVSPLRAQNFSQLPPAVITTAQLDPLRDQGEAYAESLRNNGIDVQQQRLSGTVHGFIGSPKAMRASSELAVGALLSVNQPLKLNN